MHYYKRNLGDYYQKAGRLSMLQHGSYTLLIDACYDREKFPTKEEAIEWAWASSSAELEAVEFVLNKFFNLENGVYVQSRIREEIENYHSNSETNKRIAIERETKRKEKNTNRERTVNEAPPNQEPRTKNHKPETNKKHTAEYSAEFLEAWAAYPPKAGASKKNSYKAWLARIKSGVDPQAMIDGVARYARFIHASETSQQYTKQPETFFGVGEHYNSDWTHSPSKTKPQTVQESRLSTARQIMGSFENETNRQIIDIGSGIADQGGRARIPETFDGFRESDGD